MVLKVISDHFKISIRQPCHSCQCPSLLEPESYIAFQLLWVHILSHHYPLDLFGVLSVLHGFFMLVDPVSHQCSVLVTEKSALVKIVEEVMDNVGTFVHISEEIQDDLVVNAL